MTNTESIGRHKPDKKMQANACIIHYLLGWQDSNLRMAEPKSAALPLGDTPKTAKKLQ